MKVLLVTQSDTTSQHQLATFLASQKAGIEHDPRWLSVFANALNHQPMSLLAYDAAGTLVGYLPLVLVASRLFGRFLVSLPYLNRAGILATSTLASEALLQRAVELAREHKVQYLELRHDQKLDHLLLDKSRDQKVRMLLDLPSDTDTLWTQLHSKVRNQIRKGTKNELSIKWGQADCLNDFYHVFSINMRDLGTPVYSRYLFEQILIQFESEAELAVVYYQAKPIAAALLVHGNGITQVPSASSLRAFNKTNGNMWMYHQLLCRAIERGQRQFDFGRSSVDSNTYKFKKQWGATPTPTIWQYHLCHGDIDAVRPDSPKYQRRIALWQKLPVWLTRLVGPAIVRGIP